MADLTAPEHHCIFTSQTGHKMCTMTEHFHGQNVTVDAPLQKCASSSAIFLKLLTVMVHVPTKVGNHDIPLYN